MTNLIFFKYPKVVQTISVQRYMDKKSLSNKEYSTITLNVFLDKPFSYGEMGGGQEDSSNRIVLRLFKEIESLPHTLIF